MVIDTRTYQAIAVAIALETYAQTGVRVNREYTPMKMMRTASKICGKKFRARDYRGAATALRQWARDRENA